MYSIRKARSVVSIGGLFLALVAGGCAPEPAMTTGATAAQPSAFPQTNGSVEVIDILAGKRRVTPDWAAINAAPLGSRANPVRSEMPAGEAAYLARLVCSDGSRPAFQRIGSFGQGPYTTIIDGYGVRCPAAIVTVYMDMYHAGYVERRPVPGFRINPP